MSATAKVGAFFLLALLIAGWLVLRIQNFRLGERGGKEYFVELPEAGGLPEKAPVLLRGVRVGRITDISLVEDSVRVELLVRRDVTVREGAIARVVSIGFVGEKQLEIIQGPDEAPPLPEGARLQGTPAPNLDELVQTAGQVGEDVGAITRAAREALTGPDQQNKLNEALTGFTELTKELKKLTSSLNRVVERFDRATGPTPAAAGSQAALATGVGGAGPEQPVDPIAQSVQDTREASAALRRSAEELEALIQSIRQGQGSIGRLVTDTETADRLDETLSSINETTQKLGDTLGFASDFSAKLSFRADYRFEEHRGEGYLSLELRPTQRTFLRLQGIGTNGTFTASALLGKRYDPVVVRLGLIRAHPGIGGDLLLLGDRLRFSGEIWNFERVGAPPHARLESAVYPLEKVFLVGGWDDFLTRNRGTDTFFLGAGFDFGGGSGI